LAHASCYLELVCPGPAAIPSPTAAARSNCSPAYGDEGRTEAIMRANDFTVDMLVELVRGGLASAEPERMIADGKTIEVTRLRITDEGRRELAT
jgi:hypothetical protein